jgi:hypothetical protein
MGGKDGSALRGAWETPKASDRSGRQTNSGGQAHLDVQANNWATPNTLDSMPPKSETALHREMTVTRPGRSMPSNLRDQATQMDNWPTPNANVSNDRESPESWHARAQKTKLATGANNGLPLTVAATQWQTPAARDTKGANSAQHSLVTGTGRKHMDQLCNFVAHSSHRAQILPSGNGLSKHRLGSRPRLNPIFTEWLMGWPTQWTKAEPSASSAAVTVSWRLALASHLSTYLGEPDSRSAA